MGETRAELSVDEILHDRFGFKQFLPGQERAIRSVLDDDHTLLVLPTGGGKSLCYQLPSLVLEGQTVVISPLISLMQDQINSLREFGITSAAINSSLSNSEQSRIIEKFTNNEYDLVYMAPERLRDRRLMKDLADAPVSLFAIDEAHCISEWGHDFRPDYLRLPKIWNALGKPTILASTATATPKVRDDIQQQLDVSTMNHIVTGFNRPNLSFVVEHTLGSADKKDSLPGWLTRANVGEDGSAIVYVSTRKKTEAVSEFINAETEFDSLPYHAGMDTDQRKSHQQRFTSGDNAIMVATNAFGMGIDKEDVRLVLHWDVPGNVESYYQEAGRAGRDRKPAHCVLLYDRNDLSLQEKFIEWGTPTREEVESLYGRLREESTTKTTKKKKTIRSYDLFSFRDNNPGMEISVGKKLLEEAGIIQDLGYQGRDQYFRFLSDDLSELDQVMDHVEEHKKNREDQLEQMVKYAEKSDCRRRFILEYFGDESDPEADVCCDVCAPEALEMENTNGDGLQYSESPAENLSNTLRTTYSYFREGHDVSTIAEKRDYAESTIQGHLGKLLELGVLEEADLDGVFSIPDLDELAELVSKIGSTELRPLRKEFPGDFGYAELRYGLAILKGREESPNVLRSREERKEMIEAGTGSGEIPSEWPNTFQATLDLVNQGLSAEGIAEERELSRGIVLDHLTVLHRAGFVELDRLEVELGSETIDEIREAVNEVDDFGHPSFQNKVESFKYPYGVIRCGLAILESRGELPEVSSDPEATGSEAADSIILEQKVESKETILRILELVESIHQPAGITLHGQVLRGRPAKKLERNNLLDHPLCGSMEDWTQSDVQDLMHELIDAGLLDGERGAPYLNLTELGKDLLEGDVTLDEVGLPDEKLPVDESSFEKMTDRDRTGSGLGSPLTPAGLNFCVFDLETTGFQPKNGAEIIEVGGVRITNGVIGEQFCSYVKPEGELPPEIVELTGIRPEDLEDARPVEPVLEEFHEFVGESCLVAHNLSFDRLFLEWYAPVEFTNPMIDTLKLARTVGDFGSNALENLVDELGIDLEDSHRALDDAKATAKVFLQLSLMDCLEGRINHEPGN